VRHAIAALEGGPRWPIAACRALIPAASNFFGTASIATAAEAGCSCQLLQADAATAAAAAAASAHETAAKIAAAAGRHGRPR